MIFTKINFDESAKTQEKINKLYKRGYRYAILTMEYGSTDSSVITSVWRSRLAASNHLIEKYGQKPQNIEIINLCNYFTED